MPKMADESGLIKYISRPSFVSFLWLKPVFVVISGIEIGEKLAISPSID